MNSFILFIDLGLVSILFFVAAVSVVGKDRQMEDLGF